jgi:hypothetical protein
MSISELKFSTDKRPTPAFRANPTEKARSAVLASIAVQRTLLNSERTGTAHSITKTVKTVDPDGNVITNTVQRKPRKWWFTNPQGVFLIEVLFGGQPIAINGKQTAIEAGDLDGVEKVLTIIATAVGAGELDKVLADAKSKRKAGRPKKAS